MSKKDKKICFVIPTLSSGGAERVVATLSSELAESGMDISVVKYFESKDEYKVGKSVKVFCLSNSDENTYGAMTFASKIKRLRDIFLTIKPDYIIPFLPHVAIHSFLACIGLHALIIQTVRNDPAKSPSTKLQRLLRNLLIVISYKTFVQTDRQLLYFPKKIRNKIYVLPNPVASEMFEIKKKYISKLNNVVMVGRLVKQKDYYTALNALKLVKDEGINVNTLIYGDGELRTELEKNITKLGIENCCKLCGRTNPIDEVYRKNDIFLMSSAFEGMPNSLMEALSAGMPCISTNCKTGPAELIGNDRGILVDIGDAEQMANAIIYFVKHPDEAYEMGQKAKEYMLSHYNVRIIARKFISLL